MPVFTPKERRAHYNNVGYHDAPVKANSKFSEAEQRSYARGQADARNEQVTSYLLGKNSPLTDKEKAPIKAENREMRKATPERRAEIKAARQARAEKSRAKRGK